MTMEFDTITTSDLVTLSTFIELPGGVRSVFETVEISTSRVVIVPKTTSEPRTASISIITVEGSGDGGDSSSAYTGYSLTTVSPDRTSPVLATSSPTVPISDPSDRVSSVPTTSSPIVPTANSPSTPRPTSNNSIAPGAAAGIGVGSAAASAFIAALIVWFIMRKARKSPQIPNDDPGGSWLSSKTA